MIFRLLIKINLKRGGGLFIFIWMCICIFIKIEYIRKRWSLKKKVIFYEEFLFVVFRLSSVFLLVFYYGSCIVFVILVWLVKVFIWKYILRLFFNYYSWMYESRGSMLFKIKFWLVGFLFELYMYMNFWFVRKY